MRYRFLLSVIVIAAAGVVIGCSSGSQSSGDGVEHNVGATLTALPHDGIPTLQTVTPFPPEQFGPITIEGYWTPEPEPTPPTPDHEPQVRWYFQPCEVQGMDIFKGLERLAVPEGFEFIAADGVVLDGEDNGAGLWFEGPKRGAVPPDLHVVRRRLLDGEKVEVWPGVPGRLLEKRQYGDTYVVILWHYPGTMREVTIVDADNILTTAQSDAIDGEEFENLLTSLVEPAGKRTLPDFCTEPFTPRPTPPGGMADY